MTVPQRVRNILGALLQLAFAVLMFLDPENSYKLIAFILAVSLIVIGIRELLYYASMARHMVGGRITLFKGLVLLDFGMLTYIISNVPRIYVLLYLLVVNAFRGVIEILHAVEAKRLEAGSWRINLAVGISNVLVAGACLFSLNSTRLLVYLYAAGLAYAAVLQFAAAVRRTAIVYIP